MEKIQVCVTETYTRVFEVEAADIADAQDIVQALLDQEVIEVDTDADYVDTEIEASDDGEYAVDEVISQEMVTRHYQADYYEDE